MSAPISNDVKAVLDEVQRNFNSGQRRRFLPALLIAFIEFFRELDALGGKYQKPKYFYQAFPRQTVKKSGAAINTLVVQLPNGKTKSIRPHYNAIADWFRSDQKRFDFPSSAPHATQAWNDYTHWFQALLSASPAEIEWLEAEAKQFVLDSLPSQAIDPEKVKRKPPLFQRFLEEFEWKAAKGVASGAAYQGAVFGYVRADAPHLQVEVGKVRTGSKREKRVGDVDARDGADLVLSAEVKQFRVGASTLPDLAEFSKLIAQNKALGLVVALSFEPGTEQSILDLGLQPLSKSDLIERVRLWDPLKQQIAMNAVLYYASFREQSSALHTSVTTFMERFSAEATGGTAPS